MKLNSKNLRWILIGGLGLCLILFIAVVSFGLSALSSESHRMVDLKVKSQTADNQLSNLEQSKKDIEKYSYFKDVARSVIPNDKDQAVAVLEISQMAQASGVVIQSITFPTSSLGLRTTAPTTSQDATSSGSAATAISQAKPVTGIPGLYSLELTITTPSVNNDLPANSQVTYPKMLDFLNRIENNRHTAQITQISIQPSELTQALSFSLTINIFIKP
jgi:hypothetical protein